MHLCRKQQRVLSKVFGDIRRRVVSNAQKTGESPVVDAIGFRTSGVWNEWWYEQLGQRVSFRGWLGGRLVCKSIRPSG